MDKENNYKPFIITKIEKEEYKKLKEKFDLLFTEYQNKIKTESLRIIKEAIAEFEAQNFDENAQEVEKVDDLPSMNELEEIAKKMKYNKNGDNYLTKDEKDIYDNASNRRIINNIIDKYTAAQPKPTSTKSAPKSNAKTTQEGVTIDNVFYLKKEVTEGNYKWYERLLDKDVPVTDKSLLSVINTLDKTEYTKSEIDKLKKDKEFITFTIRDKNEDPDLLSKTKKSFYRDKGIWRETIGVGINTRTEKVEQGFMDWLYNQYLDGFEITPKNYEDYLDRFNKIKESNKTEEDLGKKCKSQFKIIINNKNNLQK